MGLRLSNHENLNQMQEDQKEPVEKQRENKKRKLKVNSIYEERRLAEMHRYRNGYPGMQDDMQANDNYLFYTNRVKCRPDDCHIDTIHRTWSGNYDKLEKKHGFIQWLFPVREPGMNWQAQDLQLHEIQKLCPNPDASRRIVLSYRMMLDFYGIDLIDSTTGEVRRTPDWKSRFENLNTSAHNYLRITRMLKSLGELGFEHYQAPLVQIFLYECLLCETLPRIYESCVSYWIETVKDDGAREDLKLFVEKYVRNVEKMDPETNKTDTKDENISPT